LTLVVFGFWFSVFGFWFLVFGFWFLVLAFPSSVCGSRFGRAEEAENLKPETVNQEPKTENRLETVLNDSYQSQQLDRIHTTAGRAGT